MHKFEVSEKNDESLNAGMENSSGGSSTCVRRKQGNSDGTFATSNFFEPEPGVKLAHSDGFHGTVSHILTFEPSSVRALLAPFLSPDLTVFYSIHQWMRHFLAIGYALLLTVILGEVAFPDGEKGELACDSSDSSFNENMCQLVDVLEQGTDDFQWLIGFVLAGFVANSVAVWARRRQNYASLCGTARNLNILVASFVPLEPSNRDNMETRKTLGRWIMLAMELSMLKARGAMDSEMGLQHLNRMSLLEPGEWEAMVPGDRHSTIFWWIQMELTRLQKEGIIPIEYVCVAANHISAMRAQANDLMSSLDRDKPFPYVALCGLLVEMNVFMFSTWKGAQWAVWYRAFGDDFHKQSKFWVDIIVLFLWNMGYVGLYDLGYFLHNPFGGRRVDVAHELIWGGIRTLSSELALGEVHLPPYALKKRNKTQDINLDEKLTGSGDLL